MVCKEYVYVFLHNFISMQFFSSAFGQLVNAPAVLNAAIQNLTDLQAQFILDDVGILYLLYVRKQGIDHVISLAEILIWCYPLLT